MTEHHRSIPWFHLRSAQPSDVHSRLTELSNLHSQTNHHDFVKRMGQALEIAVFRALTSQSALNFLGSFRDLEKHNDSTLYSKEEPPPTLSGRTLPNKKLLDYLVIHPSAGLAGVETKNVREWFYPNREEVRDLLLKCCHIDVVPVLIARRIHYSSFSVLNPCGVLLHQTYNQLYPSADSDLAQRVKEKSLLGYHDVRVGNTPDARLNRFISTNLPLLIPHAREQFTAYKDLLAAYADGTHTYKSFAARVKRRLRGEAEDLPPIPAEPDDFMDDDIEDNDA